MFDFGLECLIRVLPILDFGLWGSKNSDRLEILYAALLNFDLITNLESVHFCKKPKFDHRSKVIVSIDDKIAQFSSVYGRM